MDQIHDADPLTVGLILKYIGYGFLGLIAFLLGWIGMGILNYFKKDFSGKVTEITEACKEMQLIAGQFKALVAKVEHLDKMDTEIKKKLELLEFEQREIQKDILAIRIKLNMN